MTVISGFLVVKRFEPLFREFAAKQEFELFGSAQDAIAVREAAPDGRSTRPRGP